MRVYWTNHALDHLLAIQAYVGQTSEVYAERILERLVGRSEQLAAFPQSGRRVPEYERDDIREIIERPYRVLYRVRAAQIDVLAVVHSRQPLPPTVEGL